MDQFKKQVDNVLYEAGLDKPIDKDLFDLAKELKEFFKYLPKFKSFPPEERDTYFRDFMDALDLFRNLIVAVYPHLLINQDHDLEKFDIE